SIPLPPPDLQALSFTAGPTPGTLELSGRPSAIHRGVIFTAYDQQHRAGVVVGAADDGSFASEPFAGAAGDLAGIWYESNGDRSQISTCTVQLDAALNSTICH